MNISSISAVENIGLIPVSLEKGTVQISLLIPTYNRSKFLESLLERLSQQVGALPPGQFEVLVVDNASTDDTESVARKFESRDWFRYIRNSKNVGASKNLFVGLGFCQGAYVWWMGDDDFPEDGVIEAVLDTIRWNPGVGTIFLNRRLINAKDDSILASEYVGGLKSSFDETLMELLQRIGPMTLFGSISAFVFENTPGVAENHQHYVDLMTSFPHVGLLLEQFHSRPAIVIGNQYVVCRVENHRLDTFDYSKVMQRTPNYGLSIGYAKLLYSLAIENNFPIYRIQSAYEYSPFHKQSLVVPEYIAYHLRCASAQGDPANIYELNLIREMFKMFSSNSARKEYELVELGLRATWFAHRILLRLVESSLVILLMKSMAGSIYHLRRVINRIRGLCRLIKRA